MTNPSTVNLKNALVTAGIGTFASPTSSDWAIFIGTELDTPKKSITLYLYNSTDRRFLDLASGSIIRDRVQVRVRDASYTSAYAKSLEIHQFIKTAVISDSGATYEGVNMVSAPHELGRDEENRCAIFVADYELLWKVV